MTGIPIIGGPLGGEKAHSTTVLSEIPTVVDSVPVVLDIMTRQYYNDRFRHHYRYDDEHGAWIWKGQP